MFDKRIVAVAAALLMGTTFTDVVHAYPTTARSGTSTVTGVYRPLVLDLDVVQTVPTNIAECTIGYGDYGPVLGACKSELYVSAGEGTYVDVALYLTGTYRTVGDSVPADSAPLSGNAGYWAYEFTYYGQDGLSAYSNDSTYGVDLVAGDGYGGAYSTPLGTLTYLGGGSFDGVPYADTPQTATETRGSDWFQYYTTVAQRALRIMSEDPSGSDFTLSFEQDIKHLGPFGSPLDVGRTNTACFDGGSPVLDGNGIPTNAIPCGSVTLAASAVPEPASLALIGLGLLSLAFSRDRKSVV